MDDERVSPHIGRMRYVHTNIVARDWRALAAFYEDVFECRVEGPVRDQRGAWLDRGIGIEGVGLEGVHLRLPGCGEDGPTLEIYTYTPSLPGAEPSPVRPGYGHIAFRVDDVDATLAAVVASGGSTLGRVSRADVDGVGRLTFVYARDPEGNVLELQNWS